MVTTLFTSLDNENNFTTDEVTLCSREILSQTGDYVWLETAVLLRNLKAKSWKFAGELMGAAFRCENVSVGEVTL